MKPRPSLAHWSPGIARIFKCGSQLGDKLGCCHNIAPPEECWPSEGERRLYRKVAAGSSQHTVLGSKSHLWYWILRVLDRGGWSRRFRQRECIDLGAASWDAGFDTPARMQGHHADTQLWWILEAWRKQWPAPSKCDRLAMQMV